MSEKEKCGSYLYDSVTRKICSLSHMEYDIKIYDFIMHMNTVQRYKNQSANPQELLYKFFTNKTSTIYSIEIEIYNPKTEKRTRLKAKIFEKEEAKEKYDDAISSGDTAMLVEQKDDEKDVVELNLGNISVGWEVTIWMKIVQEIRSEKSLKYPLSDLRKIFLPSMNYYGSNDLSTEFEKNVSLNFDIQVSKGSKILEIKSPSHEEFLLTTNTTKVCTKEKIALSTDFQLHITVQQQFFGTCLIEKDEITNHYAATISFIPRIEEEEEEESEGEEQQSQQEKKKSSVMSEVILVLDCSGSMGGSRMKSAKNALKEAIEEISKKKDVKTNIIRFGSRVTSLFPNGESQDIHKKGIKERLLGYIQESNSNMGGTNIKDALECAIQTDLEPGYSRQIVLLSDGEDYRVDEIIQFVKKNASTTRIFCFGIGNGIDTVFMNQLAAASNGRTIFVDDSSDIGEKVVEQFKFILQKSLTSIDVEFEKDVNCMSVLRYIPPIYNLQKHSLYYFLEKPPLKNEVVLTYYLGKEKCTEEIPIILINNDDSKKLNIGVLSSKRRVLEIEDFYLPQSKKGDNKSTEEEEKLKKEIIDISMKYQFLSTYTSFLLVKENEESSIMGELEKKEFSQLETIASAHKTSPTTITQQSVITSTQNHFRRKSRGTCYSIHSEVLVKNKYSETSSSSTQKIKRISEVEEGDYVQSFDSLGEIVYSKVLNVHNPFEQQKSFEKVEVINFICSEIERELKVTSNHYLYTSRRKVPQNEILEGYRMKIAEFVQVGDYLLFFDSSLMKYRQVQIKFIRYEMDYVLNPMVENTRMIVNGFCTSVLTGDCDPENSLFFRMENAPISVNNWKKEYLIDSIIEEEFEELNVIFQNRNYLTFQELDGLKNVSESLKEMLKEISND